MQHRKRSSAESSPGQSVSVPGMHALEAVQTHRSGAAQCTLSAAGGEAGIRTSNAGEIIKWYSITSRQQRAVEWKRGSDGRIGRGRDAGHYKYDGLLQKDFLWHVQRFALPRGGDFSDDYQNDPGIIIPCKREDYSSRVRTSGNFCVAMSFSTTWMFSNRFDPLLTHKVLYKTKKSDPKRVNAAFDLQNPDASTVFGSFDALDYEFRGSWHQGSSSRRNIS